MGCTYFLACKLRSDWTSSIALWAKYVSPNKCVTRVWWLKLRISVFEKYFLATFKVSINPFTIEENVVKSLHSFNLSLMIGMSKLQIFLSNKNLVIKFFKKRNKIEKCFIYCNQFNLFTSEIHCVYGMAICYPSCLTSF